MMALRGQLRRKIAPRRFRKELQGVMEEVMVQVEVGGKKEFRPARAILFRVVETRNGACDDVTEWVYYVDSEGRAVTRIKPQAHATYARHAKHAQHFSRQIVETFKKQTVLPLPEAAPTQTELKATA